MKRIKIKQKALFGSLVLHSLFVSMNGEAAGLQNNENENEVTLDKIRTKNPHLNRAISQLKIEQSRLVRDYDKCHDKDHEKYGGFERDHSKDVSCPKS